MSQSASIFFGESNGYSWIRVCGRGDVFLAPSLKKLTDSLLSAAGPEAAAQLVLDMEECSGKDSTFMGMLAGIAIKVKTAAHASLQLCGVTQKNQDSLEELGLNAIIEINPSEADWLPQCPQIRAQLSPWSPSAPAQPDSQLVLDTHKTLGSLNASNQQKFSDVIDELEQHP